MQKKILLCELSMDDLRVFVPFIRADPHLHGQISQSVNNHEINMIEGQTARF